MLIWWLLHLMFVVLIKLQKQELCIVQLIAKPVYSVNYVSQQKVSPKSSCSIFTQAKYISVKFCQFTSTCLPIFLSTYLNI